MAIAKAPGLKKKDKTSTSKVGSDSKSGQTVAAPGYKMGLVRNQADTKNPTKTKTLGEGAKAVSVTTRAGIIAPNPVNPATKALVAPNKKSAVGKVIKKVGRDIDYAASQVKNALTPSVQKRSTFKGNRRGGRSGGKTCAAY